LSSAKPLSSAPASVSAPPLSVVSTPVAPSAGESNRGLLLACLFALYVIWGSTYLGIRWALQGGFPPFLMAGARFTLAGLLLYTLLRVRGHAHPTARQWGAGALIGFLLLVIGHGCVVFAQQWVPSGVAALVVGSVPLWAALSGGLFGQWPGRAERWGLAIGFCGLVLLNLGSDMRGNLWAAFALLLGPLTWAFGSIWQRRLPMAQGLMSTASQMLTGGAMFLVLSLCLGERLTDLPSTRGLLSFGYLVVFGSLVAFSAYGYLLRNARPALATSYAYVNPMVAVLLGTFLAGESLSTWSFIAMGAILGAVVLLTRARR
jgi:drug/metabolite transporter (DMT)-like permease